MVRLGSHLQFTARINDFELATALAEAVFGPLMGVTVLISLVNLALQFSASNFSPTGDAIF